MMRPYIFLSSLMVFTAVACSPKVDKARFVGNWIELTPSTPQITQGVTLNADGSALSIGMATLRYESWALNSDTTLILFGKSIGNGQTIDFADTVGVIKISVDSMSLCRLGYRRDYFRVANIDSIRPFNVLDSLVVRSELGATEERVFEGITPAASNPSIQWTLNIYNQTASGDGVYKLQLNYKDADEGGDQIDTTYGRLYTLRGDATNKNATVYQLIPFGGRGATNFLRLDRETLKLLNDKFEQTTTSSDYSLTLRSTTTISR